ncbi:MAG: hypothetical protein U0796_21500 [Gemmatales bacterium]
MANSSSKSLWKWGIYSACILFQLIVAYFCWIGYRAASEPPAPENEGARVIYAVVGLACVASALGQVLFLMGFRIHRTASF